MCAQRPGEARGPGRHDGVRIRGHVGERGGELVKTTPVTNRVTGVNDGSSLRFDRVLAPVVFLISGGTSPVQLFLVIIGVVYKEV